MWCSRRAAFTAAAVLALAGCGFTPLYDSATPAAGMHGQVAVDVIDGGAGFVMRERLVSRLGPADAPTHRLVVGVEFETFGVALTTQSVTTRFNVVGRADYALVPLAGGPPVLVGDVRAITGYSSPDVPEANAFATESAERDAFRRLARILADDIVLRLALSAGEWAP
jgi:LPS-assembly lipoprotein